MLRISLLIVLTTIAPCALAGPAAHVIVIGVDGLSPDGIRQADTPNMDRIMREGAFTFHVRAVFPSSSSPNWASMIMGAGPEQHGVHSNDWRVDKFILPPIATGSGGFFPTMFDQVRRHSPDAVMGVFHDWAGFTNLFAHSDVNRVYGGGGPAKVTGEAIVFFREMSPHLLFIHLDHVDHAGHDKGHGTAEYFAAVQEADTYIGEVLDAVGTSPLSDSTFVIVTSDHGGISKGHGGWTIDEMEIPWMILGPGVHRGHEIAAPVNTYDTAATVTKLLGATPHPAWIARPVDEAFGN